MFKDSYFGDKLNGLLVLGLILTLGLAAFVPFYWSAESARQSAVAARTKREYAREGAELFAENCSRCHGDRGQGSEGVVSLNYEGFAEGHSEERLHRTIAQGRPGTEMNAWSQEAGGSLTSQQVDVLVAFLHYGNWARAAALAPSPTPTATVALTAAVPLPSEQDFGETSASSAEPLSRAAEAIRRGAKLFAANCTACHGLIGEGDVGPSLNREYHLKGHNREFLWNTIAWGRTDTRMPAWSKEAEDGSLDDQEIDDVMAFITSGEWPLAVAETVALAGGAKGPRGRTIFLMKGCPVCHKVKGRGGTDGPDLSDVGAQADADYIRQSILEPNAVIVEEYETDVMPTDFREKLADEELSELVKYLLSLK